LETSKPKEERFIPPKVKKEWRINGKEFNRREGNMGPIIFEPHSFPKIQF